MEQSYPRLSPDLKYRLYEHAVQDPETTVAIIDCLAADLSSARPIRLREDFCGTFCICCSWVKSAPDRRALGLDIDSEPLSYGMRRNLSRLSAEERSRVRLKRQDAVSQTLPLSDVICACNFSFYVLKTRKDLLAYFRACRASLRSGGIVLLQMGGGPGFTKVPQRSQRSIRYARGRRAGDLWFRYFWEQRAYNPISHSGVYSISFRLPEGPGMRRAFSYDWRVWTIAEVEECLRDAGFEQSAVYWEDLDHKGEPWEAYKRIESPAAYESWVCFVAGMKARG